jgi:hypothetical protein
MAKPRGFKPLTRVRINGSTSQMTVDFVALENAAFATAPMHLKTILSLSDDEWVERYVRPCAIAARNHWLEMNGKR